jgi:hypothetical protein
LYGQNLEFTSLDTEWINFVVRGYVDNVLFRELEENRLTIFGADFDKNSKFQIVRPMGRSSDKGVFLHHQGNGAFKDECSGGFWYY